MGFNGQSLDIPAGVAYPGTYPGNSFVLALDASNFHRFGVIANSESGNKWETLVYLKNNLVEINPVSSKVIVNDRPATGRPRKDHRRCRHPQGPKVQPRGGQDQW